jgi:hypothetical protein
MGNKLRTVAEKKVNVARIYCPPNHESDSFKYVLLMSLLNTIQRRRVGRTMKKEVNNTD